MSKYKNRLIDSQMRGCIGRFFAVKTQRFYMSWRKIQCKFHRKFTTGIFIFVFVEYKKGGGIILTDNAKNYCEIYEDLADILKDVTEVEKIYNRYRGLTITFPKKLYNKEFVLQYISENYGKESLQEIARDLDLSERRVKQLLKEVRDFSLHKEEMAWADIWT